VIYVDTSSAIMFPQIAHFMYRNLSIGKRMQLALQLVKDHAMEIQWRREV
jgi:hypothetical protein